MATKKAKLALKGGKPVREKPFPSVYDYSGRNIGKEELRLLKEVIESGALNRNNGNKVAEFEKKFTEFYGRKCGIAVTSGTAALHLALGVINPDPGDEIITTPITDMGTVIPILYQNAIPIFADVNPHTLNLDPEDVKKKITTRTKAIVVVHLFGFPADMDAFIDLGKTHNLVVVEDCCQAFLAEYKGKKVGVLGDMGCFSLQQSKHITSGDGGVMITDKDEYYERARLFSDKAWPRSALYRDHLFLAPNYRMTELQGAVALAQLNKLEDIVARRRQAAAYLRELLLDIDGVILPPESSDKKHSYWFFPFLIDTEKLNVDGPTFARALKAEGIPVNEGYLNKPLYMYDVLHSQRTYGSSHCPFDCPHTSHQIKYQEGLCPQAEYSLQRLILIFWNEFYTREDVEDIATAIKKVSVEFYP